MTLQLGVASADITPRWPVPLAGFAFRAGQGPARNVARPLRLRVLALGESGCVAAVFVSADLIWWGHPLVDTLRSRIAERLAMSPAAVVLHATHGHSGPQTAHGHVPLLGEPDQGYLDHLAALTLTAVTRAARRLAPVTVERAHAECGIGVNRRGARHGRIRMLPNPAGPVDPEVTVLRFRGPAGDSRALLVHFACHPVVAGANEVSSDFAGAAMDLLERDLPPGAVAVYAQSCCGDVNPDLHDGMDFRHGGEPEVAEFGGRLAAAVRRGLATGAKPVRDLGIAAAESTVDLPLRALPDRRALVAAATADGVDGQWARLRLADGHPPRQTVGLRLTAVRLAGDLVLLGFGAEPTTGYGEHTKREFAGRVLPLGYTNGMFGYLVTAAEAVAGGYEAVDSYRYFGMPAPLAPTAERRVKDAVADLIAEVEAHRL